MSLFLKNSDNTIHSPSFSNKKHKKTTKAIDFFIGTLVVHAWEYVDKEKATEFAPLAGALLNSLCCVFFVLCLL